MCHERLLCVSRKCQGYFKEVFQVEGNFKDVSRKYQEWCGGVLTQGTCSHWPALQPGSQWCLRSFNHVTTDQYWPRVCWLKPVLSDWIITAISISSTAAIKSCRLSELLGYFLGFFCWTTTDKLEFTDWSQVNRMHGCGEIAIFRQRMRIWKSVP